MTDPGEVQAAAAGGHGRLRASRADRERVIELLKVAFVQGRLTQDELDTRVGQAFASRTYADLADLTGDIPAGPAGAEPAGTPARTLAKAAHRSAICLLVAFALVGVAALTGSEVLVAMAIFPGIAAIIAASGFLGYGVVDAWQERRSRGQLPPPRRDGRIPKAAGPAAPAVIRLRPEHAPARPAPACEPTGRDGTSGKLPGEARGRRAVSTPCRAPYNRVPPWMRLHIWSTRCTSSGQKRGFVRSFVVMAAQRSGPGRRLSKVPGSGLAIEEPVLTWARPQAGCGLPVLSAPELAALGRRVS